MLPVNLMWKLFLNLPSEVIQYSWKSNAFAISRKLGLVDISLKEQQNRLMNLSKNFYKTILADAGRVSRRLKEQEKEILEYRKEIETLRKVSNPVRTISKEKRDKMLREALAETHNITFQAKRLQTLRSVNITS